MKKHDSFPALHEDGSGQTFTEVDLGAEHRLRVTRRHNGRVSLRRYNLEDSRIPQGIELYDDYQKISSALSLSKFPTTGFSQVPWGTPQLDDVNVVSFHSPLDARLSSIQLELDSANQRISSPGAVEEKSPTATSENESGPVSPLKVSMTDRSGASVADPISETFRWCIQAAARVAA